MSINLNAIELLWQMEHNRSLESQIKEALDSWNHHKETRDIVPESIVFSLSKQSVIKEKRIQDLDVKFSQLVQPNNFKIAGYS